MKKYLFLIVLLSVVSLIVFAREFTTEKIDYEKGLEQKIITLLEKYIEPNEYILSVQVVIKRGFIYSKPAEHKVAAAKDNKAIFLPFQSDKGFKNEFSAGAPRAEAPRAKTPEIESIIINLQLADTVKPETRKFLTEAITLHFGLTPQDKLNITSFKMIKKLKQNDLADNLLGTGQEVPQTLSSRIISLLKELGLPISIGFFSLMLLIISFAVLFVMSKNSRLMQESVKALADSIDGARNQRTQMTLEGGNGEVSGLLGGPQKGMPPIEITNGMEQMSTLEIDKLRMDFENSVTKFPALWNKYIYDMVYEPFGENNLSAILTFTPSDFIDKLLHIIPSDAMGKLNATIVEGKLGAPSATLINIINSLQTKIVSESFLFQNDFPSDKLTDFLSLKNEDILHFYDVLHETDENYADAFLVILKFVSPNRIRDLMDLGSAHFKDKMSSSILAQHDDLVDRINKYVTSLHQPFIKWKKANIKDSGADIKIGKYISLILNKASSETEKILLEKIRNDQSLMQEITKYHVSFEALTRLSREDLGLVVQNIGYNDLAVVLMFADPEFQDKIWGVLPEKKAQMVKDAQIQYESSRDRRKAEKLFEDKKMVFVNELKRLMQSGDIISIGGGEDGETEMMQKGGLYIANSDNKDNNQSEGGAGKDDKDKMAA